MSKNKSFEESLAKLEAIVNDLEGGNLGLDKSIAKFEEGLKVYKDCRTSLQNAEKKIKILSESLTEEEYES